MICKGCKGRPAVHRSGHIQVYIPPDADVYEVPVDSLPPYFLTKLRQSLSPGSGDKAIMKVMWISPVVLQRKNHTRLSSTSWTSRLAQGYQWLPFSISSMKAFQLLRDFLPHNQEGPVQEETPRQHWCSNGPPKHPITNKQDSIIIYGQQLLLCIRSRQKSVKEKHQTAERLHSCERKACTAVSRTRSHTRALLHTYGITHQPRVMLWRLPDGDSPVSHGQVDDGDMMQHGAGEDQRVAFNEGHDDDEEKTEEQAEPQTKPRTQATGVSYEDGNDDMSPYLSQSQLPGEATVDFTQMEREERISLIRTRLREKEDALKNMTLG